MMMQELKKMEKQHPELVTSDSPTMKVGGSAKREAGVLVKHRVPMLSLQDVFNKEDVDNKKISLNVLVRTEEQLKSAIDNKVDNIYITDYELYREYKYLDNVYYRVERLDNKKELSNERLLVGELGNIYKYRGNNTLVGDYYLNVTNSSTIGYLSSLGLERVTISVELEDMKIKDIE